METTVVSLWSPGNSRKAVQAVGDGVVIWGEHHCRVFRAPREMMFHCPSHRLNSSLWVGKRCVRCYLASGRWSQAPTCSLLLSNPTQPFTEHTLSSRYLQQSHEKSFVVTPIVQRGHWSSERQSYLPWFLHLVCGGEFPVHWTPKPLLIPLFSATTKRLWDWSVCCGSRGQNWARHTETN